MNFINPPEKSIENVFHKTFYSKILNHEVGYNIYLPPGYDESKELYPVVYHIHGWQGNESCEVLPLEKIFRNREAVTVFINAVSDKEKYFDSLLQIEAIIIDEIIPYIESHYKVSKKKEERMLSGFSMGGNMAFYYAFKHPELFGSITSYAGTFHHLYNKEYRTIGVPPEKAYELYEEMIKEKWFLEENNILNLVLKNQDNVRGKLKISLHIGKSDILFCDNEIMHLYLESLSIQHKYQVFDGADHNLWKIV